MAAGFSQLLQLLAEQDFFTLVLPFVLSYLVYYIALDQADFFGKSNKQFTAPIAIIFAFFTAYFIASNPFYQTFFIDYFGRLTVGMVGLVGLFVVLGLAGFGRSTINKALMGIVMIAIAGAAFVTAGGFGPPWFQVGNIEAPSLIAQAVNYSLNTGLVWLIVVGGVLWWTMRDPGKGGGESEWTPSKILGALFQNIEEEDN